MAGVEVVGAGDLGEQAARVVALVADQRGVDAEPMQREARADFRRAGKQVGLGNAIAAFRRRVQGMAPDLALLGAQQAID
ncbi:hypothetical protein D9M71_697620 [compost metagenome]